MNATCKLIATRFPTVTHISTDKLFSDLENNNKSLLVDCRPPEEFNISHLEGAVQVYHEEDGEVIKICEQVKDKDLDYIICYCSIGYRSSYFAAKLQNECSLPVYNLEGSIFKWANEGRPMVDENGEPTQYVHRYNAVWGLMLDAKLRKH